MTICIAEWMATELNLKKEELLIYAIIYGSSQDGVSDFCGGIEYLQKWTNATELEVVESLNSLISKNLIKRHGENFCANDEIVSEIFNSKRQ